MKKRILAVLGFCAVIAAVSWLVVEYAIPAYERANRPPDAEVTENLDRLLDGAVAFYQLERIDRFGARLPKRFPSSTQWAPPQMPCGEKKPPEGFEQPGFREMSFIPIGDREMSIAEPLNYQYQIVSSGLEGAAVFTARARGDLDCDGQATTFERIIEISNGEPVKRAASGR